MKWFKRKLAKWVTEAHQLESMPVQMDRIAMPEKEPVLVFKIYSAQNGRLLEFNKYDQNSTRVTNSIYVIDPNVDIGEYVSKCISVEYLR